ncbi:cell division protein ZapA [Desulfotruncus alcoholivorax]|uniref:cell division protein ZapA n=1 Tax=Desulfotruncus alcoholivorax TaxID=265477 RepID=UPI000408E067|nr:cell division protein ZapA [Desulfotruncus alcoholivorax]
MSSGQNRVEVEINGERYTLVGDAPPENMIKISLEVDEKIKQVMKRNTRLSLYKAAILVALNISEELHILKQEYCNLVSMMEEEQEREPERKIRKK